MVAFAVNISSPTGASNFLSISTSLPPTLIGMRCDYAALASVQLSAVYIPGGAQLNTDNSSTATLATAIAAANAAPTCPPTPNRVLSVDGAQHAIMRGLTTAASSPWASIAVSIGVASTASGVSQVAAAVTAATASSFPRTTAAWAPVWGYTAQSWISTFGSPLALASEVVVINAASFSSGPTLSPTISSSSQVTQTATVMASISASIAPPTGSNSSPNIGAIVGGAVGGVAVIAGVIILAVCCVHARAKRLHIEEVKAAAVAAQA